MEELNEYFPREKYITCSSDFEERLDKCLKSGKTPFVLLNTGSYCPVHKSHFEFLVNLKQFIESNFNHSVLMTLISPSNDEYVYSKAQAHNFEDYFIPFKDRCKLIQECAKDYDKNDSILVDKWEGSHEFFIDFPTVWVMTQVHFDEICRKKGLPENTIKVAYCVGSDMLKTSIDKSHKTLKHKGKTYNLPLIVSGRPTGNGKSAAEKTKIYGAYTKEDMAKNNLYFMKSEDKGVSSTLVRELVEKGENEKIYELLNKNVADYMINKFSKL